MNVDAVKEPSFKIEVNGRPERLNDLVVTARFESPKPVSVGYTDDGIVTSLTLSIDRFEWEFHPEPIEEEDAILLATLRIVDRQVLEENKQWQFAISDLHCENREMLDRLFAGCPVTVSVEAMIDLQGPGIEFDRLSHQVRTAITLPALPQQRTPGELLRAEETRSQRTAHAFLKKLREEGP